MGVSNRHSSCRQRVSLSAQVTESERYTKTLKKWTEIQYTKDDYTLMIIANLVEIMDS